MTATRTQRLLLGLALLVAMSSFSAAVTAPIELADCPGTVLADSGMVMPTLPLADDCDDCRTPCAAQYPAAVPVPGGPYAYARADRRSAEPGGRIPPPPPGRLLRPPITA